ncbi:MAG TPA: chalcone isomerase family protein [Deltaproteobacteria bacterium]|nr:chalcone isomerase family protein [Deltaproteobacteria bacterium]HPR55003.1 chalcone isomerase family protein [Deltaproteobacteria bacterium]HXK46340.1 chalcone isomerase family protein [Deltaproteobacteria bacterium]
MDLRKAFVLVFAMFFLASSAFALDAAGVALPDTLKAGDQDLVGNGGGKRTKFGLKVYVAALYLKQKSGDANAIINADEPMAIRLQVTSGLVTPEKMKAAIDEGFENATGGNVAPIQAKIDAFTANFKNLANGDVYDFIYVPGTGTEIYKAGKLSSTIQGLDFKKGLFGIWLCDKPAQKDLKEKMLGK